ncbi:MAG TPA: 4'-phosphopantetheinyl transferase superfamily protein [Solirubrobacterales bacterium]|nr:4'-phosphopantetheinyl transferase superfamily protein [Solirubrobacterales bacterium]
MLEEILPDCVAVAATREEIDAELFPEEEEAVANAVERRRREFVTARACARTALGRLGLPAQAVPRGERGAPRWPAGIVGSITHCDGYRACAVGHAADLATLGVDAEPNQPLPDGLLPDIALPQERVWLRDLTAAAPAVHWDRLLFSVKESIYKAWFPLAERWLGFEDAVVELDRQRCTFSARLLVQGPRLGERELKGFSGTWLVRDGVVLAAIALPADF